MRVNRYGHSGFSLVELLVVIGIIALLATLLLTVVAQARASARRANCALNLHEVWVAYSAYASDNNDRLPLNIYGADLYWITNRDEMMHYGLTPQVSDCTDMQVWPRTAGAPGQTWGSWDEPYAPPSSGIQMVPLGFASYIFRSGGYVSSSGIVHLPESSMYKTIHDKGRMMGDGQTPTPLFTCFAIHEGATGPWNAQPSAPIHESQPMHGLKGINSLQIGGNVIFKPYPGQEIYGFQGDPNVVKFYQFTGDWGGLDAMAY